MIEQVADSVVMHASGGYDILLRAHGPTVGSARAELVAAIAAFCNDGPCHIGIDSQNVVKGFARILRAERGGKTPHFANRPNSDLWSVLKHVVRAKGADSVNMTWLKGHADEHTEA
eukprot:12170435-Alexandrium_andersonii.AAC.1